MQSSKANGALFSKEPDTDQLMLYGIIFAFTFINPVATASKAAIINPPGQEWPVGIAGIAIKTKKKTGNNQEKSTRLIHHNPYPARIWLVLSRFFL